MIPTRLTEILTGLHWSRRALAVILGYRSVTTILRWEQGKAPVPPAIAEWLERVAAWHAQNQPPISRERR
jgi:transcriptional regulator with XRE-family HTH domain